MYFVFKKEKEEEEKGGGKKDERMKQKKHVIFLIDRFRIDNHWMAARSLWLKLHSLKQKRPVNNDFVCLSLSFFLSFSLSLFWLSSVDYLLAAKLTMQDNSSLFRFL